MYDTLEHSNPEGKKQVIKGRKNEINREQKEGLDWTSV